MRRGYSASNELRNLANSLGFKIYIFDDPKIGHEIKLRDKSKDGEIDAIILYKNLVFLIGINEGRSEKVIKELEKFFDKLDRVDKVEALDLSIKVTKKRKKNIEEKEKLANNKLKGIQYHIRSFSSDYKPILKKVFFAPNKQIDEEYILKQKESNNVIIDKDIHQYFLEVLNRLNKTILFNDFMYFLNVRKSDLEKKSASKTDKPARSNPFKVTRLPLSREDMIMYSFSPRVEEIVDYVTVLRMAQKYDKKGFQRMIKSNRLEKINEYLEKSETFPNNIIIFLNPNIYKNEKDFYNSDDEEITFFDEYNSLIIIDGQHRFFSFVKGNKLNRHILVTLIFLKRGDEKEKYLQMEKIFYKINKTQERVDPNLSFILKARIDPESEENFWYQVFKKLDKKGFFSGRFSFKETTLKKGESRKSIISVITYGGVLRLNKKYKRSGLEIEGLATFYSGYKEDENIRKEGIEFAFNLIKNYFDIIEKVLHTQKIEKNKLTPREIGALLRLLKHFMIDNKENLRKLGDTQDITKSREKEISSIIKYFEDILNNIKFKETIELDYPTSNWAAVEGYMLKKIHRKKSEFGNKVLLSKKGLEVYESS